MNKVVRMIRRYLLWWLVLAGMLSELRDAVSKDSADIQFVRMMLREHYIRVLPDSILDRPTVDSILAGCDKYSYATENEVKWWHDQAYDATSRRPGMRLRRDSVGVYVVDVDPHSPAYAVGLTYQDRITAVNGDTSHAQKYGSVTKAILADTAAFKTLTIRRNGQLMHVVMPLRPLPNVQAWEYVHEGTAYIRIAMFTSVTGDSVRAMLWRYLMQNVRRVVIDLRGCRGGRYDQALEVIRPFARRGDTLSVARYRKIPADVYRATTTGPLHGMPLDILIDRESASAAEVVALAVESNHYGRVLGERSFGKGIMQSLYTMPSGGYVQFTRAYLQGAGGTCIDKDYGTNGLVPQAPFEPALLSDDTVRLVVGAIGDLVHLRNKYPLPTLDAVNELRAKLPAPLRRMRTVYIASAVWTDIGKLWWVAQELTERRTTTYKER